MIRFACFTGVLLACLAASAPVFASDTTLTPEQVRELRSQVALFWNQEQKQVGFRNFRQLYPTRTIRRGDAIWPMPDAPRDFSSFRYQHGGE